MNVFEQCYNSILLESFDSIHWDNPIRMQGSPNKVPIVAEYTGNNFRVHVSLDPYSFNEKTQEQRKLVVYNPEWNSQLIWMWVVIGKEYYQRQKYLSTYWLDTPENRVKIEYRFKEIIYALMKSANRRPKEIEPYIKGIVKKPL